MNFALWISNIIRFIVYSHYFSGNIDMYFITKSIRKKGGIFLLLLKGIDIKKSYGEKLILQFPELTVYEGDRIGLIGLNGAGKTTLLNILIGEIEPDEGLVERNCTINYFSQFETIEKNNNVDGRLLSQWKVSEKAHQYNLSGGEKTRIRLAEALSQNSHILLIDEPTTNLDIDGIKLLREQLERISTFILISHDRQLLDDLCNRIIEIRDNKLYFYNGNYTDFESIKDENIKRQRTEYEKYIEEKSRLENVYKDKKQNSEKLGRKQKNKSSSDLKAIYFMATRKPDTKQKNAERSAKNILSRIEHLDKKEKPKEQAIIRPDFQLTNPPKNKIVIEGYGINFSYGKHDIFKDAEFTISNGAKTAIIGENGSGKTTLLNLIAKEKAGIRNVPKAKFGYFHQNYENVDFTKTIFENIMATSIQNETISRNILSRMLFSEKDLMKPAAVLSGGERIKLSLAKLFTSDCNILLLDEPTNFLDIPSIESLQNMLKLFEGTIVFVSHDRLFVDAIATDLLIIKNGKIESFHGNLSDFTKHREIKKGNKSNQTEILSCEMKLAQIADRILKFPDEKQKLEIEYKNVLEELKVLKESSY